MINNKTAMIETIAICIPRLSGHDTGGGDGTDVGILDVMTVNGMIVEILNGIPSV